MPAPTGFHARTMAAIAGQPVPGSQVAWLQRRIARIPTELVALGGAALIMVVALNQADDSSPDEMPPDSLPDEAPMQEPPGFEPPQPDYDDPDRGPMETPPPPD